MARGVTSIVSLVRAVLHAFGLRGLVRRLLYVAGLRSGILRRLTPCAPSYDDLTPVAWSHRLATPDLRDRSGDEVVARARALLDGRLRFYGWTDREVGWPPRWPVHPWTGHVYPQEHWSTISDDDPAVGDIKDVWEPSRFTWVFLLARVWARTNDDRWAEAFWVGVESWMDDNPPNTGVNWRCAQEASLRAIALQFGLSVFADHPTSTDARLRRAGLLLEATRRRVRPTVGYALSQRNNHAVSELCFLATLEPRKRRWQRLLRECIRDQFYADGSYSQQSPTYQRLVVHTLLWTGKVTGLTGETKAAVDQALDRSGLFLRRIIDPVSDHAPNHGPNDGALLLDLDEIDRADFAPTLDLLGLGDGTTESVAWLGRRPAPAPSAVASAATYLTLTVGPTHVLLRCGTGRHRLAHDDQLAIDVWIGGANVVPDPGTYRYTALDPWGNALTGATVHARPRVEGQQPRRLGRFLTAPVEPARLDAHRSQGAAVGAATSLGTGPGRLRRIVCVDDLGVSVLDDVSGGRALGRVTKSATAAAASAITVDAVAVRERAPVEDDPTSGWLAPHYAQRLACGATDYEIVPSSPARLTIGEPSPAREQLLAGLAAEVHTDA